MHPLPTPAQAASDFLPEPREQDLKTPNWLWRSLVLDPAGGDASKETELSLKIWPFTQTLIGQKEMLLYAQRRLMASKFADFDRGDEEAWEERNRPWDYDHLTPRSISNVNPVTEYVHFFRLWQNMIGNFHVLPFAENRSRGAEAANIFFKGRNQNDLQLMLLESLDSLDLFSITKPQLKQDGKAVLAFARIVRQRLLGIYRDWH
ncbi:MAG TPA: hypothetical protein VGE29_08200, partial [Prosthecobacter sp.]